MRSGRKRREGGRRKKNDPGGCVFSVRDARCRIDGSRLGSPGGPWPARDQLVSDADAHRDRRLRPPCWSRWTRRRSPRMRPRSRTRPTRPSPARGGMGSFVSERRERDGAGPRRGGGARGEGDERTCRLDRLGGLKCFARYTAWPRELYPASDETGTVSARGSGVGCYCYCTRCRAWGGGGGGGGCRTRALIDRLGLRRRSCSTRSLRWKQGRNSGSASGPRRRRRRPRGRLGRQRSGASSGVSMRVARVPSGMG